MSQVVLLWHGLNSLNFFTCEYVLITITFVLHREVAQLKLAEQIIAEKEHTLHAVEYRADMALMEKEALEEEIATMKSVQSINTNTSYSSFLDTSQSETSTPVRVRK